MDAHAMEDGIFGKAGEARGYLCNASKVWQIQKGDCPILHVSPNGPIILDFMHPHM